MAFTFEQTIPLIAFFNSNQNPTNEECITLGKTVSPPLEWLQVKNWFKYRRSKQESSPQDLNSLSSDESENPLITTINKDTSGENTRSVAEPVPSQDNVLPAIVRELLGPQMFLRLEHLPGFIKIMSHCFNKQQDPTFLLDILANTNEPMVWQTFVRSSLAMGALYNWRVTYGKSGAKALKLLNVLKKVPFDLEAFKSTNFLPYVKGLFKSHNEDVKILAERIKNEWKRQASLINNSNKRVVSIDSQKSQNAKRPKIEEKKPVAAVANSSFFKSAQPLPKIKMGERRTSSESFKSTATPTISQPKSATPAPVASEASTPSYRKSEQPSMEVDGKPKKSVRFLPPNELEQVKFFDLGDPPALLSTPELKRSLLDFKAVEPAIAEANFAPVDTWVKPKKIKLPKDLVVVRVNSDSAVIQQAREDKTMSVIYRTLEEIPNSPAEPDPEPYRPPTQPLVWPFSKLRSIKPQASVLPDNSFMPLLSALLGSQAATPAPFVGQLKLSSIIENAKNSKPNFSVGNANNKYQTYPSPLYTGPQNRAVSDQKRWA